MTPHEFWSAALTKMGRGIIYGQYRPTRHTLFFDDILMEGTTLEQAYDHLAPFRLKNKTPKGQFSLGPHIVFFSSHLSMNARFSYVSGKMVTLPQSHHDRMAYYETLNSLGFLDTTRT